MRDIVQCQRIGAAGERTGGGTSGSDAESGDGGQSKGYMQIYEKWHTDRMQNLGCTDLMNPYQNVRVGIDFLSYLLKKYGTIQDTLAAYNYGEKGAREYLWSNGVYVYSYNTAIIQRMKEIEEVVGK